MTNLGQVLQNLENDTRGLYLSSLGQIPHLNYVWQAVVKSKVLGRYSGLGLSRKGPEDAILRAHEEVSEMVPRRPPAPPPKPTNVTRSLDRLIEASSFLSTTGKGEQ